MAYVAVSNRGLASFKNRAYFACNLLEMHANVRIHDNQSHQAYTDLHVQLLFEFLNNMLNIWFKLWKHSVSNICCINICWSIYVVGTQRIEPLHTCFGLCCVYINTCCELCCVYINTCCELCCVAVWAVCVRAVLTSILIVKQVAIYTTKIRAVCFCFWPRGLHFHPLHYGAVLARKHLTWSIAQNTQHTPCTHVSGMQVEKHVCDTPFC